MKTLSTIALILALFSSCKKENFDVMPPETQSGKNTFGCLIDGDLFVGGCCAPWMRVPLTATYFTMSDKLGIDAWGKMNGEPAGAIGISIIHPAQNTVQTIKEISYNPFSTSSPCREYLTSTNGEVFITKFDTINKIVSGRFQFTGNCSNSSNPNTKHITQGRFDLKFDIINE
jgi:hypothetical protein